jgi:outer membrane receptor protein involved in Fe transport
VFDPVHVKLLFARAFRAPGFENIALNVNPNDAPMRPETTTVIEFEAGVQLAQSMFLTLNAFDVRIDHPIVYVTDVAEGYLTADRIGTRGVEVEARAGTSDGYSILNYSFYTPKGRAISDFYVAPGGRDHNVAFPAHKVTLQGSFRVWQGLSISPSIVFMSKRFGFKFAKDRLDENGAPALDDEGTQIRDTVVGYEGPTFLANLYLLYRNLGTEGLDLGLGIYDILNERPRYLQAYNNFHAPLPGLSREILLRLSYTMK